MATKHNIIGKITIQKIEGYIQDGDDNCYQFRLDLTFMKSSKDTNDDLDFDQIIELICDSHLKKECVKIKGIERKGRVSTSLPIVINDVKQIRIK